MWPGPAPLFLISVRFYPLLLQGRVLSEVQISNHFCIMTEVQTLAWFGSHAKPCTNHAQGLACDPNGAHAKRHWHEEWGTMNCHLESVIMPCGWGWRRRDLATWICYRSDRICGNVCWANEQTKGATQPTTFHYLDTSTHPYPFPVHATLKGPKHFNFPEYNATAQTYPLFKRRQLKDALSWWIQHQA